MIDYSGDGVDCKTQDGKTHKAQIFVGVLGYSGLIYCCATSTQKRSDWFDGIVGMFQYFNGVAEEIWLDNSSSLVKKASRLDPETAPEFQALCEYYNTSPHAVAPGEPTYKGLCENAVKQCQSFILHRLKGRDFFSVAEINQAIAPLLNELNNRPLKARPGETRRKRYEQREAQALRPLPFIPYTARLEIIERKVLKGNQIRIDNIRYNTPWGLEPKNLIVAIDRIKGTFDAYLKETREYVFSAPLRKFAEGDEPMRVEFVPEHLQNMVLSRDELLKRVENADDAGQSTKAFAQHLARLSNSRACKHLSYLLSAIRRFGPRRVEDVCIKVMALANPNIKAFKRISDEIESKQHRAAGSKETATDISGENDMSETRGAEYFSKRLNDSKSGEDHEEN